MNQRQPTKDESFHMLVWWRHLCRVNHINWITTTDERRIEYEARSKGIQTQTYGQLQKRFGDYDGSSDSDSSDDQLVSTTLTPT